jgi:hypothetical protein
MVPVGRAPGRRAHRLAAARAAAAGLDDRLKNDTGNDRCLGWPLPSRSAMAIAAPWSLHEIQLGTVCQADQPPVTVPSAVRFRPMRKRPMFGPGTTCWTWNTTKARPLVPPKFAMASRPCWFSSDPPSGISSHAPNLRCHPVRRDCSRYDRRRGWARALEACCRESIRSQNAERPAGTGGPNCVCNPAAAGVSASELRACSILHEPWRRFRVPHVSSLCHCTTSWVLVSSSLAVRAAAVPAVACPPAASTPPGRLTIAPDTEGL